MNGRPRIAIALIAIVVTFVCGGLGTYQRDVILSQPFLGDQTLADTTARFHVWPWPLKVAMTISLPAFLVAAVAAGIFSDFSETVGTVVHVFATSFLTILLWWVVGIRLDGRSSRELAVGLSAFAGAAAVAACAPLGNVGFLPAGILTWALFFAWLSFSRPKPWPEVD
jgi:hypothetical protein